MTRNEYARLSWHQRQKFTDRLRIKTRRPSPTRKPDPPLDVATILIDAKTQLAALPVDPGAQAHRIGILHELRTRKNRP